MAFNVTDCFVTKNRPNNGQNKRAPRACESCRSRKVRCDVTRTKVPCTNCRLDCKTCTVPVSKRRHVGDRVLSSNYDFKTGKNSSEPICDAIIDFGDIQAPKPQKGRSESFDALDSTYVDLSFDPMDSPGSHILSSGGMRDFSNTIDVGVAGKAASVPRTLHSYPSPPHTVVSDGQTKPTLPSFIAPLSPCLLEEDWDYLKSRGAFDIPEKEVRDKLLRAYVQWVHPFLPMLDLEQILLAILCEGETTTNRVSLLLFQAMMFSAYPFADVKLGLGSIKSTRKALFERARLLHDFSFETDRLTLLQAATLLSLWDGDAEKVRDSYYWIGIATLHANSMCLNFDPSAQSVELRRQRILKRTWWSLLVRDRLLAVALRRPVQATAFRFDVPMLEVADFELESFIAILHTKLGLRDISIVDLETLASSFEGLAQLSEYVDKILAMQYIVQRPTGVVSPRACIASLVPRTTGIDLSDAIAFGHELQNWYGYLPLEVQQLRVEAGNVSEIPEHETVQVHRALLAGYYSMALITLYRPLTTMAGSSVEVTQARISSNKTVSDAATSITDIFGDLYTSSMTSRLPDTAIAALEPAVVIHLMRSLSSEPGLRDANSRKFYLGWRVLKQFCDVYYIAETPLSMLDVAAQRLKSSSDTRTPESVGGIKNPMSRVPPSITLSGLRGAGVQGAPSPENRVFNQGVLGARNSQPNHPTSDSHQEHGDVEFDDFFHSCDFDLFAN